MYMADRKRVLFIDDSQALALAAERVFLEHEYEVVTALGGEEGFDKAKEIMPDVIILGIVMPDIDGYEVGRQLRQNPETSGIPIIFLSSKGNSDSEAQNYKGESQEMNLAFQCGASDFLQKTIAADDLVRSVKNVLWFSEISSLP